MLNDICFIYESDATNHLCVFGTREKLDPHQVRSLRRKVGARRVAKTEYADHKFWRYTAEIPKAGAAGEGSIYEPMHMQSIKAKCKFM